MPQYRVIGLGTLALLTVAGCQRNPLQVTRSICPAVAVPYHVGEVTLFNPPASRDASAIDVTATITDVRGPCTETATHVVSTVSFDVIGLRRAPGPARSVTLPFFAAVVQGGNVMVSKQQGSVTLNFADGQLRAQASGGAQAQVALASTQLPPDIQKQIARKRKAGDADAAVDPLADPEVKAAVRAATFEVLVGFQLGEDALGYNVTK